MGSYTIGQVAERSGFPATALRYYERIGLLPPPPRSAAGYRLYDDRTVARLAFIGRAKQLGCSLEEIGDLVDTWDGDHCGPVQRRLHELVTGRLHDASAQIDELTVFIDQLRVAAEQLGGDALDGPCDEGCVCIATTGAAVDSTESRPADVPIACTLDAAAVPERLTDWHAMLAQATARLPLSTGGVRIEFPATIEIGSLARLAAAEQRCCAFFRFAVTIDDRGVGLEVDAPADDFDVVAALFGTRGLRSAAAGW